MAVLKQHQIQAKAFRRQQEAERLAAVEQEKLEHVSVAVPVKVRNKKDVIVPILLFDVNVNGKVLSLGVEDAATLQRMMQVGTYCKTVRTRKIAISDLWSEPDEPIVEERKLKTVTKKKKKRRAVADA